MDPLNVENFSWGKWKCPLHPKNLRGRLGTAKIHQANLTARAMPAFLAASAHPGGRVVPESRRLLQLLKRGGVPCSTPKTCWFSGNAMVSLFRETPKTGSFPRPGLAISFPTYRSKKSLLPCSIRSIRSSADGRFFAKSASFASNSAVASGGEQALATNLTVLVRQCGRGSKPIVPFWGRCTTHFGLF